MMSREQAQALTRVVHLLRPAWNEEGIYHALAQVRERDTFEVALAAIRAAADDKARTPGVIPSPGPHWNELPAKTPTVPHIPRDERRARTCATCGRIDGCVRDGHDFVPLTQAANGRTTAAELARAELAQATARLCPHKIDRDRARCEPCDKPTPAPTEEPAHAGD